MPGWSENVTDATAPDELPTAALDYLRFVQDVLGTPIRLVSTGPKRSQTIVAGLAEA
jgi:adenylosuccinate synthase